MNRIHNILFKNEELTRTVLAVASTLAGISAVVLGAIANHLAK